MAALEMSGCSIQLRSIRLPMAVLVLSSQFVVYRQRITVHNARHGFLRHESVVLQAEHDVIKTSAR